MQGAGNDVQSPNKIEFLVVWVKTPYGWLWDKYQPQAQAFFPNADGACVRK